MCVREELGEVEDLKIHNEIFCDFGLGMFFVVLVRSVTKTEV